MALPASVTTVLVHINIVSPVDGSPATGTVTFLGSYPLRDATGNVILGTPRIVASLINGEATVSLPATNKPTIDPSGWAYEVVVDTNVWQDRYNIQVPYDTVGMLEFADIPRAITPIPFTSYETSSGAQAKANAALAAAIADAATKYVAPLKPSGDTTGVTDTAAIMAAENSGASTLLFGVGTFWVTGLTKKAGSLWQGAGRFKTIIKLATGANVSVIKGDLFDSLTQTGNTNAGIGGWGIRDLSIDGNKAGQSATSHGVQVYGYNFDITRVSILNCRDDGMYTEWADFGGAGLPDATMEARYDGLKIHDCGGNGWHNRGPHDSRAHDVTIYNNAATGFGYWGEATRTITVAAGSNGVDLNTFVGAGTLNVSSTNGFPTSGSVTVVTASGTRTVAFTGKTATAFTGCSSAAPSGSTVTTGALVNPVGAYSAAGTMLSGCHVWGSPLWDYVLDAQTHLIDCVGEVSAPGGGQVLMRGGQSQIVGGLWVIYSGFTANGCGIQIGDAANSCTGALINTNMAGFSGTDAAHAAINIVNDGGSNSIKALVYQPTGTSVFGTTNTGFSHYQISAFGAGRAANSTNSYNLVNGRQIVDVPNSNQAWFLTNAGTDLVNLNVTNNRMEFVNGLLTRWYSGAYSGSTVEIDSAKGHLNFPGTTAPTGVIVTAAIGTGANGASVTVTGNDHRGQIAITTASTGLGTFPATVCNFTFAQAWNVTARVMITPFNGASAAVQPYAQGFSGTQFLLGFNGTPAASTTYTFAYMVMA